MNASIFAKEADRYDTSYDSPEESALFQSEVRALRPIIDSTDHPDLEIGVGSGRFASTLDIDYGVDPVVESLRIARQQSASN